MEILTILQGWACLLKDSALVSGAFVFGSLIDADPLKFKSATSDIDLILVFSERAAHNAGSRLSALREIRLNLVRLEAELATVLGSRTNAPLRTSLHVFSSFELAHGIQKGDQEFFITEQFLNLLSSSGRRVRLYEFDPNFVPFNGNLFTPILTAQKIRDHYAKSISNELNRHSPDHNGKILKEIIRGAAIVAFSAQETKKDKVVLENNGAVRTDLDIGFNWLRSNLEAMGTEEFRHLALQFSNTETVPGWHLEPPLSSESQVLLAEMVCEAAINLCVITPREQFKATLPLLDNDKC